MVKKLKYTGLIFSALLGFVASSLYAGAVVEVFRLDFPSGKRIIMFGERHEGEIDTEQGAVPVADVEANQRQAFFELFKNYFAPYRNQVAVYLECNQSLCEEFKEKMLERLAQEGPEKAGELAATYMDKPWFNHYYEMLFAMGINDSVHVAAIRNFDPRSVLDLAILFLAISFSEILEKYKQCNYDQAYLDQAKKEFFAKDEYQFFKEHEKTWLYEITKPMVDKITELKRTVDPAIYPATLAKAIEVNKMLAALRDKAASVHKDVFQFLFSGAELTKQDFNKVLGDIVKVNHPVTVWQIFSLSNLYVDINLVNELIKDSHKIIVVHGGLAHIEAAYEYLKLLVPFLHIHANSLNLLTAPLMNSQQTYQRIMDFLR